MVATVGKKVYLIYTFNKLTVFAMTRRFKEQCRMHFLVWGEMPLQDKHYTLQYHIIIRISYVQID